MAARVWGGVAGWIAGLLPLVAANIADQYIEFDSHELLLLGAGVLVGGILLGGVTAATIGGRARRGSSGGAAAAGVAGGVAAALYAATIIAIVLSGRLVSSEPTLIAEHPIRASGVVVFLGALMVAVALIVGAFRSGAKADTPARVASASRPAARSYTPSTGAAAHPPSRPQTSWEEDRYARRDAHPHQSGPREFVREGARPTRERRDSGARLSPTREPQQYEADRWDRR